jgi:cobalt-zinc-cadmium efflux system outer membrane protein
MKTFCLSITVSGAVLSGFAASETAPPATSAAAIRGVTVTPEYLGRLAEEMRTNNPALRAAYARTNAAAANVNSVRTWEDPTARIGGLTAREEMRADEGDILYGVEQKLPLFGKPELARRVARAGLAAESAGADYQFQIQRSALAKIAFATALADQVVAIGEQDLTWLDAIDQTVESKYRAGQATLVEMLQVQNERARRETQLQTDRDELSHQQVALNRLLNRDLQTPWPRLELPPLPGVVNYNQKLVNFALNHEPKLRVMQEQVKQAEATVNLTRRQRAPDVSFGFDGRNYSGDGTFRQGMFVLSMNVPWGNAGHYRSDIQREEGKLHATQFDLADYQLGLREEVHRLTVKINSARREAALYRDQIIPRTESALSSARAGWEDGRGPFRDLLDARRMLLEGRLMYVRAAAEQYQMMSELVLCCGLGELGALSVIGAEPDASTPGGSNEK